MFNFLLPQRIKVHFESTLDEQAQQIVVSYHVDDEELLTWILDRWLDLIGNIDLDLLTIKPGRLIISIPRDTIPYKITDLQMSQVTITMLKE